jgi:hypothetical protein
LCHAACTPPATWWHPWVQPTPALWPAAGVMDGAQVLRAGEPLFISNVKAVLTRDMAANRLLLNAEVMDALVGMCTELTVAATGGECLKTQACVCVCVVACL